MTQARENLDLLSDILQVVNFYLLMKDASNDQLMKELQRQDKLYLERIVKNQELIMKALNIKEE